MMNTRVLVAVGLVAAVAAGGSGEARAAGVKPDKAVKALMTAQAAAIQKADGDGLKATFHADAIAWFPASTALAVTPDEMVKGMSDSWFSSVESPQKVKVAAIKVGVIDGGAAWVSAALEMKGRYEGADSISGVDFKWTVQVTALAVNDAGGGGWKLMAAQYAHEIKGKDAVDMVVNGGVEKLAAIPEAIAINDADEAAGWITATPIAAEHLGKGDVVLVGSGPKEKAVGAAKVKKMLGSWKNVKLLASGGVREVRGTSWYVVAANLDSPTKTKTGEVTVQYRCLAIYAGNAMEGFSIVSLHYASQASF